MWWLPPRSKFRSTSTRSFVISAVGLGTSYSLTLPFLLFPVCGTVTMPDGYFYSSKSWPKHGSIINPDILPIIAFDVLQILGLISISATLCIAWFSSRIRRTTAWFSSTFAWGLLSIGNLFLIGHQTGPSPDPILCLCQSMFINAFPVLCTLMLTVFILEIFLSLSPISKTAMMILYFVPYGVSVGIFITAFILGRLDPTAVRREPFGMVCHISIHVLTYVTSAIIVLCMIASLILGVQITRQWRTSSQLLIRNGTSFSLVLRLGIIGVFSILSMGLSAIDIFGPDSLNLAMCVNLAWAVFPAVVGILFGSQNDILSVLMFWRKPPQDLPIISVTISRV